MLEALLLLSTTVFSIGRIQKKPPSNDNLFLENEYETKNWSFHSLMFVQFNRKKFTNPSLFYI